MGRDPQRVDTPCRKMGVTKYIALGLVTSVMRVTIHFDGQSAFMTVKIEDIAASGVLSAKFRNLPILTKLSPQEHFWQGHVLAMFARAPGISL
jgi:hypothetical protein